ncbi:hypothetical protein EC968_009979 [Mortierella alpina]|nr:hypothetical protein EC968_009979 [Mortierella alpina]
MLRSAAHTVLSTPELILLVSDHLTPYDLAQCNLVCKDWLHQFEPILWTNFCLKEHQDGWLSDASSKAALTRNLPRIKTIECSDADATLLEILTHGSTSEFSAHCANLKRLAFWGIDCEHFDRNLHCLATLLDLNHRLTHLELPFESLECYGEPSTIAASISKLENLEELHIMSTDPCEDNRAMLSLLQACLPLPKLTDLFLELDLIWSDGAQDLLELKTIIKEASIARFSRNASAPKIKTLRFPSSSSGYSNPLPLLLLESNLLDLQACEIPWFDEDTDPMEITEVVRKHCPNLKRVACHALSDDDDDGKAVCAFIRGCSGLQIFNSFYFCDENDDVEPRGIVSTLVSQHSDTLEVFKIEMCHRVYSRDLQDILSRCKRLRRFWVTNTRNTNDYIGIESTDIWRGDWVCMDLRELRFTLNRFPLTTEAVLELEEQVREAMDDNDKESPTQRLLASASKRVYTQIGRLEKLEVLTLDITEGLDTNAVEGDYASDLTLSKGWLGELAGLKNLKVLDLQADLWSKMGQAEVEFISENWPSLTVISLHGCLQLNAQSPWLWLLMRRPNLRLTLGS